MNAEMIEMCEELATFFIVIGVELFFFFLLYNDGLGPTESHLLHFL